MLRVGQPRRYVRPPFELITRKLEARCERMPAGRIVSLEPRCSLAAELQVEARHRVCEGAVVYQFVVLVWSDRPADVIAAVDLQRDTAGPEACRFQHHLRTGLGKELVV